MQWLSKYGDEKQSKRMLTIMSSKQYLTHQVYLRNKCHTRHFVIYCIGSNWVFRYCVCSLMCWRARNWISPGDPTKFSQLIVMGWKVPFVNAQLINLSSVNPLSGTIPIFHLFAPQTRTVSHATMLNSIAIWSGRRNVYHLLLPSIKHLSCTMQ